jgi:F-type H+-transporting ATPase subunit epsilon
MSTIKFELVSPERVLMAEDIEQAIVPGSEGEFTVLPGHSPVISTLRPGVMTVTSEGNKVRRLFVKDGFAEVKPDQLVVLAQEALDVDELGSEQIADELKAAEADLEAAHDDAARLRAHTLVDQLRALS